MYMATIYVRNFISQIHIFICGFLMLLPTIHIDIQRFSQWRGYIVMSRQSYTRCTTDAVRIGEVGIKRPMTVNGPAYTPVISTTMASFQYLELGLMWMTNELNNGLLEDFKLQRTYQMLILRFVF